MEGQGVAVDLDISALLVGREHSRPRSVYRETELLQAQKILGGSVGRDGGERGVGPRSICRGSFGRVLGGSGLLGGLHNSQS